MAAPISSSSLDITVSGRSLPSSPALRRSGGFGIEARSSDPRVALSVRVDAAAKGGVVRIEKSLDPAFRRASVELQVGIAVADLVVFYGMSARDVARQLGRQLSGQDAGLTFEVKPLATRDLGVDSAELVLGRRSS